MYRGSGAKVLRGKDLFPVETLPKWGVGCYGQNLLVGGGCHTTCLIIGQIPH